MNRMMNRLIRLQALNRSVPREYRIDNAAAGGDEATIYLYDVIGYDWWTGGGVTAKQFAKDLNAITAKTINLRINSPGGDVFEGRAMVAALKAHPSNIIVHVDGLAASAASFLAMHASEVRMNEGSFMMIHNGWTFAMGDRHAFREQADILEKIDATIVADYQKRSSSTAEELGEMMDAETWMEAHEAVDRGFADIVVTGGDGKAKARAWNVAAYDRPPAALNAELPEISEPDPAPAPAPEPDLNAAAHAHRLRALALIEATLA